MRVDREAREEMAAAIVVFMRREMRSDEFDARLSRFRVRGNRCVAQGDEAVAELADGLWGRYGDLQNHRIVVTEDGRAFLLRTLAFLKTDLSVAHLQFGGEFCPFAEERDWRKYEHLLDECDVAAYEAETHGNRAERHISLCISIPVILGFVVLLWIVLEAVSR